MWNIPVFAVLGLLAGTAALLLYPGRHLTRTLGTLALGAAGAVVGGMISWGSWPKVEGQFQAGNLILAVLGAFLLIALWTGVSYVRSLNGTGTPSA
jgi:uncharacterized membrane protein YeaQ/YmgE (transglycosylase-associated protein family)